jgi:hypothetical protein
VCRHSRGLAACRSAAATAEVVGVGEEAAEVEAAVGAEAEVVEEAVGAVGVRAAEADCVADRKSERCSVLAAMRLARPARLARRRPGPLWRGLVLRVG